jgi:hypothetical protein
MLPARVHDPVLEDFTELIPAFAVVALMSFTYNVGIGITAGFVLYRFCKLVSGLVGEIKPGLSVLGVVAAVFLCFILIRRRITQLSTFKSGRLGLTLSLKRCFYRRLHFSELLLSGRF